MTETKYPISPMHQHLDQVVWYQLVREPSDKPNTGKLHRQKWLFRAQDMPCGACHSSKAVKFMVLPTGVYRSCSNEGFTEKVEPIDEGEFPHFAILLEDKIPTNKEAMDVIHMYKQEKIFMDQETGGIWFPEHKQPPAGVQDENSIE
jgi:hypothetical protein